MRCTRHEGLTVDRDEAKLDFPWVTAQVLLVDVLEEALVLVGKDVSVVEVVLKDVLVEAVELLYGVLRDREAVIVEDLLRLVVDHLPLHILGEGVV